MQQAVLQAVVSDLEEELLQESEPHLDTPQYQSKQPPEPFFDTSPDWDEFFDCSEHDSSEVFFDCSEDEHGDEYTKYCDASPFEHQEFTPRVIKTWRVPWHTHSFQPRKWRYIRRSEKELSHTSYDHRYAVMRYTRGNKKCKPIQVSEQDSNPSHNRTEYKRTPTTKAVLVFLLIWLCHQQLVSATGALTTLNELASYLAAPLESRDVWRQHRLPASYVTPGRYRIASVVHLAIQAAQPQCSDGGETVTPIHGRPPDIDAMDPSAGIDGTESGSLLSNSAIRTFLPDGEVLTPAADRYDECPVTKMFFGKHPLTNAEQRQRFKQMIIERKSVFANSMNELPGYTGELGPIQLEVISDKVVFSHQRKQSQLEKDIANEKCTEMRDAGIIEPAPKSKYASCPTIVAKKGPDGKWTDTRYCIDYCRINTITAPHNTRTPLADDIFQELGESRFYTKLDMRSGFFQIPLHVDGVLVEWGSVAIYQNPIWFVGGTTTISRVDGPRTYPQRT